MLTLTLVLACKSPEAPPPPPPPPVVQVPAPPPQPALPPDFKAPPIAAFGAADLWRRARDEAAVNDGDFDRIEVRISWPKGAEDPVQGAELTIVPVAGLAPVKVSIVGARKESEPEIGEFWELALAPITEASWLKAPAKAGRRPEYPFDAVFLLPAQPLARVLDPATQVLGDLPPKARDAEVLAAVDTSGDGRPDAVELRMCCEGGKDLKTCDYICGESWLLRDGEWVKIDASQPM